MPLTSRTLYFKNFYTPVSVPRQQCPLMSNCFSVLGLCIFTSLYSSTYSCACLSDIPRRFKCSSHLPCHSRKSSKTFMVNFLFDIIGWHLQVSKLFEIIILNHIFLCMNVSLSYFATQFLGIIINHSSQRLVHWGR